MTHKLYPRLAWQGITKNKRLYLPFLLTCVGMVMMTYILLSLASSPVLKTFPGGDVMPMILSMGSFVMAAFAVLFLFYTNSFLIRRRNREFGLYNILGMGKGNLARVLAWESVMMALVAIVGGEALGIALGKLFELVLVNIVGGDVQMDFTVSVPATAMTAILYLGIFALLFLRSLVTVCRTNAAALLRSESYGEKPPKANWAFGLAGFGILGAAYYIAVTIKQPLTALAVFFIAVLMVIVGTYLIFISGSVLLCRTLQKNKRYYYQKNHFISVSSMAYRMKRNGAGLASVCILATMVLVMISSTTCLYVGQEDAVNARYPRDMDVAVYGRSDHPLDEAEAEQLRQGVESTVFNFGGQTSNVATYREISASGLPDGGDLRLGNAGASAADSTRVTQLHFLPLEDYNAATGQSLTLNDGQVYVAALRTDFPYDTLTVDGEWTFRVMDRDIPPLSGPFMADITPTLMVVIPHFTQFVQELEDGLSEKYGWYLTATWHYAFDTDLPENQQGNIDGTTPNLEDALNGYLAGVSSDWGVGVSVESKAANRADFYGTYGGLFFLGIMLSIVFIFAAVAILYYKQLSEGYEDQSRFDIMQKVGMTKQDIRRSINSQLLTVFFLPMALAGVHLCFAFPFIHKLLLLFNLSNTPLLIGTTVVSYVAFALLYTLAYKLTSNAYYRIVSGAVERE